MTNRRIGALFWLPGWCLSSRNIVELASVGSPKEEIDPIDFAKLLLMVLTYLVWIYSISLVPIWPYVCTCQQHICAGAGPLLMIVLTKYNWWTSTYVTVESFYVTPIVEHMSDYWVLHLRLGISPSFAFFAPGSIGSIFCKIFMPRVWLGISSYIMVLFIFHWWRCFLAFVRV